MSDLTEKLKAGCSYYVEYLNGDIDVATAYRFVNIADKPFIGFEDEDCLKGVLAPVPSYEELQVLKSERDKFAYDLGVADTKNGELLRLLKKCQDVIKLYYSDYGCEHEQTESVLTKIEEAIK